MPALNEVNLNVPVGVRMALVGPNGAGKSTLLKAIAGLLPVQAGQIRVYGQPIGACHHRVAYLSQRSEVDWRFPLNVRQLALTGRYVHLGWLRRPAPKDYALVEQVLSQLHLSELAGRQIGQLSGGQQQRALLARALVQEADLLLLDEPLNAVDTKTRDIVMEVLKMLQKQGKTALVATHDLGRLAADFDGAIYLEEGRLMTPRPEVAQVAR
ncbi:MAG: ABC transporter ATP-binding protein [Anaerolineales bacterium]|nr:ABC transporter ATP-binding protein [Anaerolineales bacterium]